MNLHKINFTEKLRGGREEVKHNKCSLSSSKTDSGQSHRSQAGTQMPGVAGTARTSTAETSSRQSGLKPLFNKGIENAFHTRKIPDAIQNQQLTDATSAYERLQVYSEKMDEMLDVMVNSGAMLPERYAELKEYSHLALKYISVGIKSANKSIDSNAADTQSIIDLTNQMIKTLRDNLRHSADEVSAAKAQLIDKQKVFGLSILVPGAKFSHLQAMDAIYINESTGDVFATLVKYLNHAERQDYKVTINNGLMYDASGKLFDTRNSSCAFEDAGGQAIFVMDQDGHLYASNNKAKGKFHHSSFLAGQPVAAAGYIHVEDGVVKGVSRESGHYKPTEANLNQMLWNLYDQGISAPAYVALP
jgi:hypothetical protein